MNVDIVPVRLMKNVVVDVRPSIFHRSTATDLIYKVESGMNTTISCAAQSHRATNTDICVVYHASTNTERLSKRSISTEMDDFVSETKVHTIGVNTTKPHTSNVSAVTDIIGDICPTSSKIASIDPAVPTINVWHKGVNTDFCHFTDRGCNTTKVPHFEKGCNTDKARLHSIAVNTEKVSEKKEAFLCTKLNEHKILEINTIGTKEYLKTGQMTSISKKSDENTKRKQGTSSISNEATENSTKELCFNNIAQGSEEKTVMLQRTSITNQTKEEKLTREQGASIEENPTKDSNRMLVGNIPFAHENLKNNVTSFNLTPLIVNTTRHSTQACVPDINQHSSDVTCKKTNFEESFHDDVTDKSCSSQQGKPTTLSHALLQLERNATFPARDRSPGSNSPADADYQRSLGETNSGSETGLFASSDDSIDSVIYRGTDRQPVDDTCETLREIIINSTNNNNVKNLEISENTHEIEYSASLERDFDLLDAKLNKRNNGSQQKISFDEDFSESTNTGYTKLLPDNRSGQHAHQITPSDCFLVTHTVETFLNRNLCMELDDSSDARTPLQRVDKHALGDRGLQSDRWIRRIVTTRDRVADDDDDVEGTYSVELSHQEAEPESSEPSSPEVNKQNDEHPIPRYEYKHFHMTRINFSTRINSSSTTYMIYVNYPHLPQPISSSRLKTHLFKILFPP